MAVEQAESTAAGAAGTSSDSTIPSTDPETQAEVIKYPPGRPKAGEVRLKIPALPRPASFKGIRVPQFLDYWRRTDAKFPKRLVVYLYRHWPVCDRVRCNLNKYIDVLSVGSTIQPDDIHDADNFEAFMIHRFGEGDYKLILNDTAISREVCNVFAKYRDPDHPSIIEPLASLVVEDPSNRPFLELMARKGVKIPGSHQEQQEDDEVAKVTTELTGTVDRLVERNMQMADKVVEAATQRREEEDDNRQRSPQSPDALETSLRIVSTAADMGSKIVGSAMQKAGEIQAAVVAKEVSPVETMRGFVDLAKSLVPTPASQAQEPSAGLVATLITNILEREAQSSKAAADAIQSQNQLLRDIMFRGAATQPGSPGLPGTEGLPSPILSGMPQPGQPRSLLDQIKELGSVKRELQSLLDLGEGGGEGEGDTLPGPGKQTFWEKWLPTMVQGGIFVASMIGNSIHNVAVAKSGQGVPIAPPAIQPPGQTDTGLPAPPANLANPAGIQPMPSDATLVSYHMFLAPLREPLLQSLNNGESGYDFAEKLSEFMGDNTYQFLRGLGTDKLVQALSTYPPIWETVSKIPNRFGQFLQDFMEFGEPEDTPPPPPSSGAAPVVRTRAKPANTQAQAQAQAQAPAPAPSPAAATGVMSDDPLKGGSRSGLPKVPVS